MKYLYIDPNDLSVGQSAKPPTESQLRRIDEGDLICIRLNEDTFETAEASIQEDDEGDDIYVLDQWIPV